LFEHYKQRFGFSSERVFSLDLDFIGMDRTNLEHLVNVFSEEEIWEAIKDMPKEKVPGPDGYIIVFYQKCWHIIKNDFVEAFNGLYHLDGRAVEQINGAYTELLPKKPGACEPGDFRPISLVHSPQKISPTFLQED
jgi:mannosylglycoprotein endo-beta-mannosidase